MKAPLGPFGMPMSPIRSVTTPESAISISVLGNDSTRSIEPADGAVEETAA